MIIVGNPKVLSKVGLVLLLLTTATALEQSPRALQGAQLPRRGPPGQPEALLHAVQQASSLEQQGTLPCHILTVQAVYSRYINPALMESLMHQASSAPRDAHDMLSQVGGSAGSGPVPPAMMGGYSSRREARAQEGPRQPLSQSMSQGPLSQTGMSSTLSQVRSLLFVLMV